jgi:hypothetical protein
MQQNSKNLAERLIENEFVVVGGKPKGKYNPKDNFFGCSTYSPDVELNKGSYTFVFSVQGMLAPYNPFAVQTVGKGMGIRYIGIYYGKTAIYVNWFGELPPDELVNFILNDKEQCKPLI